MEIRPRVQPNVTGKFAVVRVGLAGKNRTGKQKKTPLLMRSLSSRVNQCSPGSPHWMFAFVCVFLNIQKYIH